VTVDYHAAQFTVTATATDSSIVGGPASDSVGHDCADNPCQAARAVLGYDEDYPGDLVADCEHDLADFAAIAAKWLVDYALTEPSVMP